MHAADLERLDDALLARRLLIVAGKGGVGKTTVAAALARRAAGLGRRVLLVDVEGKHELARLNGAERLSARPATVRLVDCGDHAVAIDACTVAPDTALVEYLDDHGMRQLSKRLVSSGAVEVIANAAPGIKDLLVLGRIKSFVNASDDLVIIDTPASGHAVSFLLGPRVLADLAGSGSIRRQSDEVMDVLVAPTTQVVLVTLPEETPVNETAETAAALRARVGVSLAAVVVNAMVQPVPNAPQSLLDAVPEPSRGALAAALTFERSRLGRQREQLRRLDELVDLPQITLPLRPATALGRDDIDALAALLAGADVQATAAS